MAKTIKDATGVFNLDQVVAITPRANPKKDGPDLATLHFVGGANIDTATTFDSAAGQLTGSSAQRQSGGSGSGQ